MIWTEAASFLQKSELPTSIAQTSQSLARKASSADEDTVLLLFLTTLFEFLILVMAARAYVIPDLDDDNNDSESVNSFSKRQKTDSSSTTITTTSVIHEKTVTTDENTIIPTNTNHEAELSSNDRLFVFSGFISSLFFFESSNSTSASTWPVVIRTSRPFSSTRQSAPQTSPSSEMGIFGHDLRRCRLFHESKFVCTILIPSLPYTKSQLHLRTSQDQQVAIPTENFTRAMRSR